jgi:hypothetical protein
MTLGVRPGARVVGNDRPSPAIGLWLARTKRLKAGLDRTLSCRCYPRELARLSRRTRSRIKVIASPIRLIKKAETRRHASTRLKSTVYSHGSVSQPVAVRSVAL